MMETGSTLLGVDSGWDVNGINHLQHHYIALEHVHDHHCHSNCSSSVFGLVFSFFRVGFALFHGLQLVAVMLSDLKYV